MLQFAEFVSQWADMVAQEMDAREVAITADILNRTRQRIEELLAQSDGQVR